MASPVPISNPLRSGYIAELDGVRGVAILVVMILHFTILVPGTAGETLFARSVEWGWAGVDLFFVLSGFLITGILLDARGGDGYFKTFYVRRALRIFPLYYAFLFALFVLLPLLRSSGGEPLGPQLLSLAYLHNVLMGFGGWDAVPAHTTHLWSLSIEEQFYMIWPLVVLRASRTGLLRISLGLVAVAWCTRLFLHLSLGHGVAGYTLLPARVDALALGALLALVVREEGWVERFRRWLVPALAAGVALVATAAIISWMQTPWGNPLPPLALHVQLLGYPGVDLLSAALVGMAVLPGPSPVRTALGHPLLLRLGKYSYALYLFHVPLRDVLRDRVFAGGLPPIWGSQVPTQLLLLAACIALTFAVSVVSWHILEKRFLRLKDRFEYRAPTPALPHSPVAAVPVGVAEVVSPPTALR